MVTPEIHVLGIDPGGTTGWCRLTIPRKSMFGDEPSRIIEWDYGTFAGPEPEQAINIARLAREIQSLAYKVGPAIVCEDWDIEPNPVSTDPETLSPVRIGAMLSLLEYQGRRAFQANESHSIHVAWLGDATLTFQGRTIAMTTATDERLKKWGLWSTITHTRAATRHAVTMLRRARQNPELAAKLWPAAAVYQEE